MSTDLTGYLYLRIIRCSSLGPRSGKGRRDETGSTKDSMLFVCLILAFVIIASNGRKS